MVAGTLRRYGASVQTGKLAYAVETTTPPPPPTVGVDNGATSASSLTIGGTSGWNHTCGPDAKYLIVVLPIRGFQSGITMTYNGINIPELGHTTGTTDVSIFALANPPVGTFPISVTLPAGMNEVVGISVSVKNASSETGLLTPVPTSTANPSVTIGSSSENSIVISALAVITGSNITAHPGTLIATKAGSLIRGAVCWQQGTGGNVVAGYTLSVANVAAIAGLSVP